MAGFGKDRANRVLPDPPSPNSATFRYFLVFGGSSNTISPFLTSFFHCRTAQNRFGEPGGEHLAVALQEAVEALVDDIGRRPVFLRANRPAIRLHELERGEPRVV